MNIWWSMPFPCLIHDPWWKIYMMICLIVISEKIVLDALHCSWWTRWRWWSSSPGHVLIFRNSFPEFCMCLWEARLWLVVSIAMQRSHWSFALTMQVDQPAFKWNAEFHLQGAPLFELAPCSIPRHAIISNASWLFLFPSIHFHMHASSFFLIFLHL